MWSLYNPCHLFQIRRKINDAFCLTWSTQKKGKKLRDWPDCHFKPPNGWKFQNWAGDKTGQLGGVCLLYISVKSLYSVLMWDTWLPTLSYRHTQSSAKPHNASPDKRVLLYLIVCISKLIDTVFLLFFFSFNITQ